MLTQVVYSVVLFFVLYYFWQAQESQAAKVEQELEQQVEVSNWTEVVGWQELEPATPEELLTEELWAEQMGVDIPSSDEVDEKQVAPLDPESAYAKAMRMTIRQLKSLASSLCVKKYGDLDKHHLVLAILATGGADAFIN